MRNALFLIENLTQDESLVFIFDNGVFLMNNFEVVDFASEEEKQIIVGDILIQIESNNPRLFTAGTAMQFALCDIVEIKTSTSGETLYRR